MYPDVIALHKPDLCCFFSSDVFVVGLIVMPKQSSQVRGAACAAVSG